MRSRATKSVLFLLMTATAPAWAVDGVVLIDQSRAGAGSVTPGDLPGFPISINQPGSYRLSGNLVVPDGNTTAIEINASHVTIDLNGFAIMGPVSCASGFPCANVGLQTGYGVRAGSDSPVKAYFDIQVRNGTISGMGADAVHLLGDGIRVEDLRTRDNGLSGIVVRTAGGIGGPRQSSLIVSRNNVQRSGSYGIKTEAALITDNVVSDSEFVGIRLDFEGVVARNLVSRSGDFGAVLGGGVSYLSNTFSGNNGGGAQVAGGINTGQNVCNTSLCP